MFKFEDNCQKPVISRTIRFTKDLFEKLSLVSSKNNVSFNYLILQCCNYTLNNLDDDQKP